MPFALIILGSVLLIASVKNTQQDLYGLVKGDFTGENNFIFWVVAILVIGALGYIPKLQAFAVSLLVLVVLVLFLNKGKPGNIGGGFFKQFGSALSITQQSAPVTTAAKPSTVLPSFPSLGTL